MNGTELKSEEKYLSKEEKYLSKYEMISYIIGMASLSMFTGMVNNYQGDYWNNILKLNQHNQQIINTVVTIVGYILGFFLSHFIDNFRGKKGKFRPLAMTFCVPFALVGFLRFYTPFDVNTFACVLYIALVVIVFNIFQTFANTANYVAYVITPNEKERNGLMSANSFFSSIMSSAPLVIILVLGIFKNKGFFDTNQMYLIGMLICAIAYAAAMLNAMKCTKERVPYVAEKNSMFDGIKDVVKNKNFWWMTLSVQVRNFYLIGTGLGIYIAGVLLGDTSKFLLIGLPTGIGTAVGMLIVQQLIKKINPATVLKIFCVWSLIANTLAFGAGYMYLTKGGTVWQIVFLFFLFTIGFQFGANNIIPNILNADVLNELELQTGGKRLEQTVEFTKSIIGAITGVISGVISPFILLNEHMIHYQQGTAQQTQSTSIKLVFFYTIFAGIFYVLSIIPLIGYNLDNKKRQEISKALYEQRAQRETGD